MKEVRMYINKEVGKICGCSPKTVQKFAQNPANKINFVSEGRRKIYIWFDEDIERFKTREAESGRPRKKPVDGVSK
jgi:hypothetical protein